MRGKRTQVALLLAVTCMLAQLLVPGAFCAGLFSASSRPTTFEANLPADALYLSNAPPSLLCGRDSGPARSLPLAAGDDAPLAARLSGRYFQMVDGSYLPLVMQIQTCHPGHAPPRA